MSVWPGIDNAIPGPDMAPDGLAPSNSMQFQWPQWGQHVETSGQMGEKPDLPAAQQIGGSHGNRQQQNGRIGDAWKDHAGKAVLPHLDHAEQRAIAKAPKALAQLRDGRRPRQL